MGEMGEETPTYTNHVAVLAFPFGTHAAPLLNLTRRLAASAPNATFSFFSTAKSNCSIFGPQHHGFGNIKAYNIDDGVPEGYVFAGRRMEDIELFLSATPGNYRKGIEEAVLDTGKGITCFLSDTLIWHAADMAQEMNVPWIPFWTAAAGSLCAHLYTDLIRETAAKLNDSGLETLPLNFVPGMPSALSIKDVPMEVLGGDLNSTFSHLMHQMARTVTRGTAVAINSLEELDPSITKHFKSKFQDYLPVGPFNLTSSSTTSNVDPHYCLTWLNKNKPSSVAYVSFGTVTTPPPHELIALANALENSGMAFLWSLKDNFRDRLPQGFVNRTSRRGLIVPWAPQSKILEHPSVVVFITHCGWNSVIESVTGGVPMICRPFFGDQKMNGRLVSDVWQIGVQAQNGVLSEDGLMDAFDMILSNDQGKNMKENVVALKELAVKAVGEKGSSTMNFYTLLGIVTGSSSLKPC
uniref:Glycosyltransferase n=1 Tax=Sinopodophyllum hexandrum TaxID=93608 RepID=A0A8K1TAS3_SINHE|nr:UDP-glycosyltransferase superfamily protein [Sinopodophyllum hexandrum]